jgi:hypothetical protein
MFVGKGISPPYSGTHERLASDKHYSLLRKYIYYKNMALIVAVLQKSITFASVLVKARLGPTRLEPLTVLHSNGRLLALSTNI